MSLTNSKDLDKKIKVAQQTTAIHEALRLNRIQKKFGKLTWEELFEPNTRRLDNQLPAVKEEPEAADPEYAIKEFDYIIPLMWTSSTPATPPPPQPQPEEWGPSEVPEYMHTTNESIDLGTIKMTITKLENTPGYKKTKKWQVCG